MAEPLQRCKTDLLKGSPLAGRPHKEWSRRAWLDPTPLERQALDDAQAVFCNPQWLTHWDGLGACMLKLTPLSGTDMGPWYTTSSRIIIIPWSLDLPHRRSRNC